MHGCIRLHLFLMCGCLLLAGLGCNSSKDSLTVKKVSDKSVSGRNALPAKGALSLAVVQGNAAKTLEFLKNGADINENVGKSGETITPLFIAIATANSQITQILLQNGADQNLTYRSYSSKELAHFQSMTREVLSSFEGVQQ